MSDINLFQVLDSMPISLDHGDTVANSCLEGEESDLDEPKAIARAPADSLAKRHIKTEPLQPRSTNGSIAGPSRTGYAASSTKTTSSRPINASLGGGAETHYYMVQWRRFQTKKVSFASNKTVHSQLMPSAVYLQHKTWDGDAYMRIEGNKIHMCDEVGKPMATSTLRGSLPVPGAELKLGQMDIEVDRAVSSDDYHSATSCINTGGTTADVLPPPSYRVSAARPIFQSPLAKNLPRASGGYIPAKTNSQGPNSAVLVPPGLAPMSVSAAARSGLTDTDGTPAAKTVSASTFYASQKTPKADKIVLGEKSNKQRLQWGGAIHDPSAEGAIVMPKPPSKLLKEMRKRDPDFELIDVVIDPLLAVRLRDHQKEGVKFMYNNIMGYTGTASQGCILADEMGLGKTLQTIALIYTLLKQTPFPDRKNVIEKALIVCPVTLVKNWKTEFSKWIGNRVNVIAVDGTNDNQINGFVLIIGYERLRKVIKKLVAAQPKVGLIVCDEGHRLKTKGNKTTQMFDQLSTPRRIILSGTPVQNDLEEYWAMVDFCCPGLLGRYKDFNRQYEKAIIRGRTVGCSPEALAEGHLRADELSKLSKEFVLRRTGAVLENFLPPKYEYVVFVAPSAIQLQAFQNLLTAENVVSVLDGRSGAFQLSMMDALRKVSNSPMITRLKRDGEGHNWDATNLQDAVLSAIPGEMSTYDVASSGKLYTLDRMLFKISSKTDDKVVVASSWTSTLDLIQEICKMRKYSFLRLDGKTPNKARMDLVTRFNRENRDQSFIFLLSTKAGGTGINLIGASRLILFDLDWNPSNDLQAMARVHREGQKKPVFIYRLLNTNTIDEKVFQRQITKTGLSDQMLDQAQKAKDVKDSFTQAELRDIFSLSFLTNGCNTHDLLGCDCDKAHTRKGPDLPDTLIDDNDDRDRPSFEPASQYNPEPPPNLRRKMAAERQEKLAALRHWTHIDAFNSRAFTSIQDPVLYDMVWEDEGRTAPNDRQTSASSPANAKTLPDTSDFPFDDEVEELIDLRPPAKKHKSKRSGLANELFPDEDDDDLDSKPSVIGDAADAVDAETDSKLEDERVSGDSDEDEPTNVPKKRKIRRVASSPSPTSGLSTSVSRSSSVRPVGPTKESRTAKNSGHFTDPNAKKHNLKEIADRGQAGRVMFIFEKFSTSRMGGEEEETAEVEDT